MSGAEIAAEIKAAYAEVGEEVGSGALTGTIVRKGANTGTDYDPVYGPDQTFNFTVTLGTFSNRERAGTAIKATDTRINCSTGDTVPVISDKMRVGGVDYVIYGVDPLKSGGVDLKYKIWARK